MKESITKCQFMDRFRDYDRQDQFSYDGLSALYDWLEDISENCGTEYELDVIALCCEFSEYGSALECVDDCGYSVDFEGCESEEDKEEVALEYLHYNTMVIEYAGGIIIQSF